MKALSLIATLALFALVPAACRSNETTKERAHPANEKEEDDAAPAVATVFLRGNVDGERAKVEVVARGASRDVHGAAFRLRFDPDKLSFVQARASDAWSGSIRLAREGLPGELVVVWTKKGDASGIVVRDETLLGTIDFSMKGRAPTNIMFRADRSTLRDAAGGSIPVEWHDGEIAPR